MPRTPSNQAGFTLLELLVVITLVGIMAGVATLSVGGQQARQLKNEAQRLQLLLNQARDESELTQRTLGVKVDKQGYQFLEWQRESRQWQLLETRPYQSHQLASKTQLTPQVTPDLDASHKTRDNNSVTRRLELKPQIIFSASGDHSAFSLNLSNDEQQYQLSSDGYAATKLQACSKGAYHLSVTSSC